MDTRMNVGWTIDGEEQKPRNRLEPLSPTRSLIHPSSCLSASANNVATMNISNTAANPLRTLLGHRDHQARSRTRDATTFNLDPEELS